MAEQDITFGYDNSIYSCEPDNVLEATAAAVCTMGLAGEIAFECGGDERQ